MRQSARNTTTEEQDLSDFDAKEKPKEEDSLRLQKSAKQQSTML